MSMTRYASLIITLLFFQGCSIGWYSLRDSNDPISADETTAWNCPTNFTLSVISSHYTNTFGEQTLRPEQNSKLEEKLISSTEKTLNKQGCHLVGNSKSVHHNTLTIKVIEHKYLSALPQEWLTGLSLGLIPSWGTRPSQWKFEFKQGDYARTFEVDDTRFNHLIAFPFFWLSSSFMDIRSEYEEALREYAKNS